MLANIAATDLQVLPPEEAARVAAPELRVRREPAEGSFASTVLTCISLVCGSHLVTYLPSL